MPAGHEGDIPGEDAVVVVSLDFLEAALGKQHALEVTPWHALFAFTAHPACKPSQQPKHNNWRYGYRRLIVGKLSIAGVGETHMP